MLWWGCGWQWVGGGWLEGGGGGDGRAF